MQLLDCIENSITNNLKENCVVYCDDKKVIKRLTYEDIKQYADVISRKIKIYIKKETCIGLILQHNVYLPSIIISIMRNENCFMFLNTDCFKDTINQFKVCWLISYNVKLPEYELVCQCAVAEDKIYIWKTTHEESYYAGISYIVLTSGTTGLPKVVKVQHECIASNIFALLDIFHLKAERIYCGTPLTFDPSVVELFLTLTSGSSMVMVEENIKRIPHLLLKAMFCQNNGGVTFIQISPSVFCRWHDADVRYILQESSLKYLVLGGEPFPNQILHYYDNKNNVRIFNIYGITEVSCWASIFEVTGNEEIIYFGDPLNDTILDVRRNADNTSIFDGEGELYIGSNVRKCLLDSEQERDFPGVLFRPTGDLVRINGGKIRYLGRINDTVKRFGLRINIIRIENIISRNLDLTSKIVWFSDDSKLVLFVKIDEMKYDTKTKICDKIRIKLLQLLSSECMPDDIQVLYNFPVTANGKINVTQLQTIYKKSESIIKKTYRGNHKQIFMYMLSKYLGLTEVELLKLRDRSFLEIGGNSIMAMQLLSEYEDITQSEYPSLVVELMFKDKLQIVFELVANHTWSIKEKISESLTTANLSKSDQTKELQVLWKHDMKACVDSSPIIIGNSYLAIGSFSHDFVVLNIVDGQLHFQITLPSSIESPALHVPKRNCVITGCYDGHLYCISLDNQQIVWTYKTDDVIKCKPTLCLKGNAAVFGSYDKHVHCIDTENGSLIWKTPLNESVTATPISVDCLKSIAICTIMGKCAMLDENDGSIKWIVNTDKPILGSPCLFQYNSELSALICANVAGELFSINITDGSYVWKHDMNEQIFSSVVAYKNGLVVGTQGKKLYGLEHSPLSCTVKFFINLDAAIIASPCVCEDLMVVATTIGSVFVMDFATTTIRAYIKLNGQIFSTPVIFDENKIILGCRDNNLYCMQFK